MSTILLVEQTAPDTPSSGQVIIYPKTDGKVYTKDDAGTESVIATGSATQAEQETGTSTAVFVSPGTQRFNPSALKAWVNWDGDSAPAAITADYRVASIADGGTGVYTFTTDDTFSPADYSFVFSMSTAVEMRLTSMTGTTVAIQAFNSSGVADDGGNDCSGHWAGDVS